MNMHLAPLTVIVAMLAWNASLSADDTAVTAKLARIPPAAAEALRKAAGSAKIEQVSIDKDGKVTIYEIDLTEPGKPHREVSVTADGQLNAEEETVPLEKLPDAVRKAIEAGAKGARIERVNRIKRSNGDLTYEALYVQKSTKTEVEFFADGKRKP
ncbi:MAG: hypothetical protein QOE70_4096 [Chthoniobacter sp.]|jgi:uncharacterized membrane protein YkoI|nr:hypothetical protein [Chthoniobacter sp.]